MALENLAAAGIVVHYQDPGTGQRGEPLGGRPRNVYLLRQLHREPEGRAGPGGTRYRNRALHRLDQCARNREPQASSAVMPGGRGVDLREGLKEQMLLLSGYSDAAVAHFKA